MPAQPIKHSKYKLAKGVEIPSLCYGYTYIDSNITTNYDVVETDVVILVDTNISSVTINLTTNIPFSDGKILYIKDIGKFAGTNNISFDVTVDNAGGISKVDQDLMGVMLMYINNATTNGSEWIQLMKLDG